MSDTFDKPGTRAIFELQKSLGMACSNIEVLVAALKELGKHVSYDKKGAVRVS